MVGVMVVPEDILGTLAGEFLTDEKPVHRNVAACLWEETREP